MTHPTTLAQMFLEASDRYPKPDRVLQKRDGRYVPISSADLKRDVLRCAAALQMAGVRHGDRVALLSYNRVEWAIVDYAAQILGAPTVPLYSTLPADQCAYILQNSEAKILFVEDKAQYGKITAVRSQLPALQRVVALTPVVGAEGFDQFLAMGDGKPAPVPQAKPEDLATLIYTSGTTGVPKGVMLTNSNLVSNMMACCELLNFSTEDVALSFLPVSHIFERIVDYALFNMGATIAYCENIDKVADNMQEVHPTIMGAVPRFYEKVYGRIQEALGKTEGLKKILARRAIELGRRIAPYRMRGETPPLLLRLRYALATKLVLKKFHARTGGRIRLFVSGGAPLSKEVGDFFWSLGFTVLEGYGLTETSPVIAVNVPGRVKVGTVGPVIPGVEVRIASDGEILCKGPNVMKGYYKLPQETAESIKDGWFHTGDIGVLEDGFLRITDRKKDLMKTSGGKYIAPQPIENRVKMSPLIANVVLIADRRKFASALVVPNFDILKQKVGEGAPEELIRRESVQELYKKEFDSINSGLAQFERIKRFELLPADFTIDNGELTPTMKVRRRKVEEKYRDVIEKMYVEAGIKKEWVDEEVRG